MGSYPTASFPSLLSKTMDSYLWTTTSGKEVEELYQQFEHYLFKRFGQAFYLEARHIGNDRTVEKTLGSILVPRLDFMLL